MDKPFSQIYIKGVIKIWTKKKKEKKEAGISKMEKFVES